MADNRTNEPPLTEPEIVQCLYLSGIAVEIEEENVRLVGWVQTIAMGEEAASERRIVARFAVTKKTARELAALIRKGLSPH